MSGNDANYCDPQVGAFGYIPSLAPGIVFSILFIAMTIYALYYTVRRRVWYVSFFLGGVLESVGWIGRAVAHSYVCSNSMFIMQITCLIVAPAFFSATLYIILGILIQRSPESSVISSKMYIILFCSNDFLSLLFQAVGGGLASSGTTAVQVQNGTDVMVAGVFVQIAGMTAFVIFGLQFFYSAARKSIAFDGRVMSVLVIASLLIFIRNIYRAVELLEGWTGHINTTEGYLIGLDGVPMVLTLLSFCYLVIIDGTEKDLLVKQSWKKKQSNLGEEDASASSTSDQDEKDRVVTPDGA